MLHIYPVVLEVIASLRPLLVQIERRDRDLGRQLRRASASVALNVAEGMNRVDERSESTQVHEHGHARLAGRVRAQ